METQSLTIYHNSHDLVKDLKKNFKSYRKLIKSMTTRDKRFPFIVLDKCFKLDEYSIDVRFNGFNESNDRKISQILHKIDPTFDSQPNKKRKTDNSFLDLSKISNENEQLNYEMSDEESGHANTDKNLNNCKSVYKTKLNGVSHNNKSEVNKKLNSNGCHFNNKSVKQDLCNGLSVYSNNINDFNFKIPKCTDKKESIESIISFANTLVKNNKRCGDAFNHLSRYLSEDQWTNTEIIETLAKIALGIASISDLGSHINGLDEVIDKIKSLQYTDDDFWDELIFRVDKKRNDLKYAHVSNLLLPTTSNF